MTGRDRNPASWIGDSVKRFVGVSPENSLKNKENERAWADPIVGFSSGADPLYQFFKKDIGEFYLSPLEIFARAFPKTRTTANQLTVISWVLPHTEATKNEHRKENRFPTERWARARIYGENFNDTLRRHVVSILAEKGYESVAPSLSHLWGTRVSGKYLITSNWSERHAAYVSGLGTFGLCDGLITPVGKAMRCGSAVAKISIPPSERPYTDHHAYCLFFSKGTCGKCVERCPVGAISKAGHDKIKCREYVDSMWNYVRTHYGFEGYGCGLCQTGVPCESGIPS
ncbi:MAG: epoxyqueuosine reductase [Promethearchaeati archaeon SRVP18_Atabeyarchaeia-1]